DTLRQLANLAGITLENNARWRETRRLARLTEALSENPDFSQAMQRIVECANEVTGADSSSIYLLDRRTDGFVLGSRWPAPAPGMESQPRAFGGLTRSIIDTGEPVKIDDAAADPHVRDAVKQEQVQSLVGVRIQTGDERIGALYV